MCVCACFFFFFPPVLTGYLTGVGFLPPVGPVDQIQVVRLAGRQASTLLTPSPHPLFLVLRDKDEGLEKRLSA